MIMHTRDVNGVPLFQSRGSCTCQSMMLEGMLNIYEEIFTDMLNKSEKKELKSSVKDIMSEVKNLKHKYSEEHRLWRDLQEIHFTKVIIRSYFSFFKFAFQHMTPYLSIFYTGNQSHDLTQALSS